MHAKKDPVTVSDIIHECRTIYLERMPRAEKVLSIGSSGSWYFHWFDGHYPFPVVEHMGIDLNEKPADLPGNVTWLQHDGSDLAPVPPGSFDLAFAGQFIEHISWAQQVRFLAGVNRALKDGGFFVLDSPDYDIVNRYGWKQPEHVHELTFAQAQELLSLAGFEVLRADGIIPVDQLGAPPGLSGKYLDRGFDSTFRKSQLKKSLSGRPGKSFIWWVVARKVRGDIDVDALGERLEAIYRRNESVRNTVLFHQIGRLEEAGDRAFVAVARADGPGFALYGPYMQYLAGNYRVTFELMLANASGKEGPEDVVCLLDVAAASGEVVLASRKVSVAMLSQSCEQDLSFSLGAPAVLEFRVRSAGFCPFKVNARPVVSGSDK